MPKRIAILGAGITGLCCSYFLKNDHIVFEKDSVPGGVCKTDCVNGFHFDYAEHFIRVPNEEVKEFISKVLGNNLVEKRLNSAIYIEGRYIPYPFQKNIFYLSNTSKKKCVYEFLNKDIYKDLDDCYFGNWILKNYGAGISQMFMFPYNKKIWCVEPNSMRSDFSFDPKLIPAMTNEEMLDSALLSEEERSIISEQLRYYVSNGGIQSLSEALSKGNENIKFNKEVSKISIKSKTIFFTDGTEYKYDFLISTIPITNLVDYIYEMPNALRTKCRQLIYNSAYIINIALKKELNFDYHWLYMPESNYSFSRIYCLKNFSENMVPKGKSSLSVLMTYLPEDRNTICKERILSEVTSINLFKDNDIDFVHEQLIDYAFPIPTIDSVSIVEEIKDYLKEYDILTIGRYGEWRYLGIEHAIMQGEQISRFIEELN